VLFRSKALNQTFKINITLNNVTPDMQLTSFEFKLQFNTTLLEIIDLKNGSFLEAYAQPPNGGTLYFGPYLGPDYVLFNGTILPNANGTRYGPYPSGNGTIATITFRVKYQPRGIPQPNAACNLILFDTKLTDSLANNILHNTQNGFYDIVPTPLADINFDGVVDIYDAIMLANSYGSKPGDPNWNSYADLVHNNAIDIYDAIVLANNFGQRRPDP
jgi:hypothetical protein